MAAEQLETRGRKTVPGVGPLEARTVRLGVEQLQIRLEPSYWEAVDDICRREELSVEELCAELKHRLDEQVRRQRVAAEPATLALPKAMRVFIVGYFRQAATENGHDRAGHGRGTPFTSTPFEDGN